MGQVALGFRSLLIKLAVFFVMAALLAWALGGTLWPRAEVVDFDAVTFDGREWFWRLSVGGREEVRVRWTFMSRPSGGEATAFDDRTWVDVAGPVTTDDAIYYAGRASHNPEEAWHLEHVEAGSSTAGSSVGLPDRLAADRQLARVKAGLAVQGAAEVRRLRPTVLDPPGRTSTGDE